MKTLTTIFAAIILTTTLAMATTAPEVIVTDSEIEIVEGLDGLFVDADFNAETQNLSFSTKSEISYVQIINNEGVMEFQLPVDSNIVKINKNLFSEGNYKLGFIFKGESESHFTTVLIK